MSDAASVVPSTRICRRSSAEEPQNGWMAAKVMRAIEEDRPMTCGDDKRKRSAVVWERHGTSTTGISDGN